RSSHSPTRPARAAGSMTRRTATASQRRRRSSGRSSRECNEPPRVEAERLARGTEELDPLEAGREQPLAQLLRQEVPDVEADLPHLAVSDVGARRLHRPRLLVEIAVL